MSGSDCAADDIELLLTVETIFNNCILRAARGDGWQLPADQLPAIEQVVLLHERVLAVVPQYRYRLACQRLEWFVHSRRVSPLPGSRLTPTGE
ncbi:hypothetical protein [Paraburkholderia kururiensis]|uniref:hypothetical protein n=1 Tax=Paraburkholderia kururiensis TaxID=984307 RepID=UPI000F87DD4F|nr:hypothetical protein [Paraburkholderia kururiensis]